MPAAAAPAPGPEPFISGLEFPTNMAFAPDGRLFFTEKQTGNVRIVADGELVAEPFATLPVLGDAERGLLGIAIGPDFERDPWVYLYLSDASDGVNRLVRMRADGDRGGEPQTLLSGLSSEAGYHNGGDLAFGVDGTLYASIGEGHDADRAQDTEDLGGKIVRLNADGSVPADNPFGPENPVWSYGHRNSFGLCVDPETGDLWETENGPGVDDEVNRIEPGANYGWPQVTGDAGGEGLTSPVVVFADTIAVTGCALVGGDLFFGSFDGRLWRLPADQHDTGAVEAVATLPDGITDVVLGPDGSLYIATSTGIWTMGPRAGGDAVASASATSPASGATVAAPAADAEGGSGSRIRAVIAIGAMVVLGVGLGLRLSAGRRLRRRS